MSCTGNVCAHYDGTKCVFTGENATGSGVYCPLPEMINNHDPRLNVKPDDEAKPDMVNQPPHYTQGGIECIDAIRAAVTGKPSYEAWLTGQIIKYVWRYNFKNGKQDLEKAEFYLKRLIEEVKE